MTGEQSIALTVTIHSAAECCMPYANLDISVARPLLMVQRFDNCSPKQKHDALYMYTHWLLRQHEVVQPNMPIKLVTDSPSVVITFIVVSMLLMSALGLLVDPTCNAVNYVDPNYGENVGIVLDQLLQETPSFRDRKLHINSERPDVFGFASCVTETDECKRCLATLLSTMRRYCRKSLSEISWGARKWCPLLSTLRTI